MQHQCVACLRKNICSKNWLVLLARLANQLCQSGPDMNPDVIKEALSLNSVVGLALLQKTTVPYFCAKDQHLNEQQQQTLACLIGNIIKSIASGCVAFEFQVMDYYAYAYPLKPQVTFVILARQPDVRIKLLGVQKWQSFTEDNTDQFIDFFNAVERENKPISAQPNVTAQESPADVPDICGTIEELLLNLNSLSQAVSHFLGPVPTANFWLKSRPEYVWIESFEVNPLAEIIFTGNSRSFAKPLHHLCLQQWTHQFMNLCSQSMQDLPQKVAQHQESRRNNQLSIVPVGNLTKLASLEQESTLLWD